MSSTAPERIEDYALSVLLHDIGKFWERSSDAPKPSPAELQAYCPRHPETGSFIHLHAALSARFIQETVAIPGAERWGPRHHLPDPSSREEVCAHLADRLAAGDLSPDDSRDAPHAATTPLRSPWSSLAGGERAAEPWYLPLARADQPEGSFFPRPVAPVSREDYRFHWNHFLSAADRLGSPLTDLETWSALLEVFTSRIPSAATNRQLKTIPEIDLYSHSRVVAALAVALHRGPLAPGALAALSRRAAGSAPDEPGPALVALAGGAVDGAERFLSAGADGPATIAGARGRALCLDLLTEAAARRFALRLGLPPTSILEAVEGRFVVLAPPGAATAPLRDEVDRLLGEETGGELGLEAEAVDLHLSDFRAGCGGAWSRLHARLSEALAGRLARLAVEDHRQAFGPPAPESAERRARFLASLEELGRDAAGARFWIRRRPRAGAEGWRRLLGALDFLVEPAGSAAGGDGEALAIESAGRLDLEALGKARRPGAGGGSPALSLRRWPTGEIGAGANPSISARRPPPAASHSPAGPAMPPAVLVAAVAGLDEVLPAAAAASLERLLILPDSLRRFFCGWASSEVSKSFAGRLSLLQAGAQGICVLGSLEAAAGFARELERGLAKLTLGLPSLRFLAAIAFRPGSTPDALREEAGAALRSLARRGDGPRISLFGEPVEFADLDRIGELARCVRVVDRAGRRPEGLAGTLRAIALLRRRDLPHRWRWNLEALLPPGPLLLAPSAVESRRRTADPDPMARLTGWLLDAPDSLDELPLVLRWAESAMEGEEP